MGEEIFAAAVGSDEAEALSVVEPLDCSSCHLCNFLKTKNIFAQVHYIPVHLMPYYKDEGYKLDDYPKAEQYYSRCLSLPMYPTLTELEQEYVIEFVCSYYNG